MSGVVVLIAILIGCIVLFGDTMAHYARVLFSDACSHRIPWDMPCVTCEEEGRFRRW